MTPGTWAQYGHTGPDKARLWGRNWKRWGLRRESSYKPTNNYALLHITPTFAKDSAQTSLQSGLQFPGPGLYCTSLPNHCPCQPSPAVATFLLRPCQVFPDIHKFHSSNTYSACRGQGLLHSILTAMLGLMYNIVILPISQMKKLRHRVV